ncbi:glycosyl hydrolase [Halomicroarcula sp. GCM10025710]
MVDHGIGDAHIRFGWEFNGRWAADGAVGRPEIYTAAWRNVVSAMRGVDGAEFSFIWAPNIWRKQMAPTDAYPGDEWVTEIGLTMYDKGDYYPYPEQCDSNCVAERRRQTWQDILEGRQTYYGLNYWAALPGTTESHSCFQSTVSRRGQCRMQAVVTIQDFSNGSQIG